MIKTLICIGFVWLCCFTAAAQSWTALKKEQQPIMTYTVNDTLSFPVYVVEDPDSKAFYFATQLQTNVCNDQVCLPIEVNLFWDLLGNYHHFSRDNDFHFTKFDHQYFEDADYKRLQEIMLDSLSVLRDYQVEDLLDKEAKKYSLEVDAVTKPTSPLFSNVTVPGALYTVYTLWHIVNGSIKQALYQYAQTHYQERAWASYFAQSKVPVYQEYFLKQLSESDLKKYQQEVVALLFAEDDFVPHYAIDVLEKDYLIDPKQYNAVLHRLSALKPHVTTEVIKSIANPNKESKELLMQFQQSSKASPKQKELILKIINHEK